MKNFYRVRSASSNNKQAVINVRHIVTIEPLFDGEKTSVLLDSGSFYIVEEPYESFTEKLLQSENTGVENLYDVKEFQFANNNNG